MIGNLSKICVLCGLILPALPVCGFSDTLPVVFPDTTPAVVDPEETVPVVTDSEDTTPAVSAETSPAVTCARETEKKKHLSFKGFIASPNLFRKDGQRGKHHYLPSGLLAEPAQNPQVFEEKLRF